MGKNIFIAVFVALSLIPISSAYIIKPQCTGSMMPVIQCGDRLEVNKTNDYVVGDIVGYKRCEYSEETRKSHNGILMLMKKKICEPGVYVHTIEDFQDGMFWIGGTGRNILLDSVRPQEVLFKVTKVLR